MRINWHPGNLVWKLGDWALDHSAPLAGIGAAAAVDKGYMNAAYNALRVPTQAIKQVVQAAYEPFTVGGILIDNAFIRDVGSTIGHLASNVFDHPTEALAAGLIGYGGAKLLARLSSSRRKRIYYPDHKEVF